MTFLDGSFCSWIKDFSKFITSVTGEAFDSEFEEAVYDALVNAGFDTSSQVGCSGYRVDLAIKNPEKLGEYILGIECDGSQYHSSRYARDRDKVRQQVLEKLGWHIHRIWSNDWIRDQQGEINKIKEKVDNLLVNKKNGNKKNNTETKFIPVSNKILEDRPFNEKFPKYKTYDYWKIINIEITQYIRYGRKYISYDPKLDNLFLKILNVEGPMEKELLFLRASQVINKKRGSKINKVFNDVYKKLIKNSNIYENGSTVDSKSIPTLSQIRISDEKDRKFIYIPKEEIAAAIVEILKNNFTSDIDSIKKDVSQGIYNIKKIGSHVDKKISTSLDYLLINGIIQNNDEKISLKN